MPRERLTQRLVDSLKPKGGGKSIYFDELLSGFICTVYPSGKITFGVNLRVGGKLKRITVGQHPAISVSDVREKARPLLQKMYEGIDPIEEKAEAEAKAKALSTSLEEVNESYFRLRDLKPKTKNDMQRNAQSYLSDWLPKPIRNITRKMVEDRFTKLKSTSGLATAGKTMRYLSAVMNFAKADETSGGRLIEQNPCDVLKEKKVKRTVARRESHLDDTKLAKLFQYIHTVRGHPESEKNGVSDQGINLVMLLLQTGLRKSEALGLKWEDVDLEELVFVVRDTKNGTDHYVPITTGIEFRLREQQKVAGASEYVFPARYGAGRMTEPKTQLDRIRKATGLDFTFHDLRRTFATQAHTNGVEYEMIRRALNHRSGGGITASYIVSSIDVMRPVFQAVSDQYDHIYHGGSGKAEYDGHGKVLDWGDPGEPI